MADDRIDEVRTEDAEGTYALGRALAGAATPLPADGLVVALHGDLGAGKTLFVKGVAAGLGIGGDAQVVSPTFTIARSYPAPGGVVLHHLDAYRLGGGEELEGIGFEDMRGPGRLTCVEWAERVADALPEDRIDLWLELHPGPEGDDRSIEPGSAPELPRRIRLRAGGLTSQRILGRLGAMRRSVP